MDFKDFLKEAGFQGVKPKDGDASRDNKTRDYNKPEEDQKGFEGVFDSKMKVVENTKIINNLTNAFLEYFQKSKGNRISKLGLNTKEGAKYLALLYARVVNYAMFDENNKPLSVSNSEDYNLIASALKRLPQFYRQLFVFGENVLKNGNGSGVNYILDVLDAVGEEKQVDQEHFMKDVYGLGEELDELSTLGSVESPKLYSEIDNILKDYFNTKNKSTGIYSLLKIGKDEFDDIYYGKDTPNYIENPESEKDLSFFKKYEGKLPEDIMKYFIRLATLLIDNHSSGAGKTDARGYIPQTGADSKEKIGYHTAIAGDDDIVMKTAKKIIDSGNKTMVDVFFDIIGKFGVGTKGNSIYYAKIPNEISLLTMVKEKFGDAFVEQLSKKYKFEIRGEDVEALKDTHKELRTGEVFNAPKAKKILDDAFDMDNAEKMKKQFSLFKDEFVKTAKEAKAKGNPIPTLGDKEKAYIMDKFKALVDSGKQIAGKGIKSGNTPINSLKNAFMDATGIRLELGESLDFKEFVLLKTL